MVNGLATLVMLSAFMLVASSRMQTMVRIFALQSLALGALAASVAYLTGSEHIYLVAGLTIGIKALLIPRILSYVMKRIKVENEVEPLLNTPSSLLVSAGLAVLAYHVAAPIIEQGTVITRNAMALSLGVVLIGFFIMISRWKAITQVIGLLCMENGLFMAAISATYGMPLIVELGIFFDILVAVLIMGVFAFRINRTFDTLDTAFLRRLRD
ncbi:MAG: hydrogenase [Methanomassiliicoccales archaeon]|nr:hydrogenase [Methanomassiliicoccales archaeon]